MNTLLSHLFQHFLSAFLVPMILHLPHYLWQTLAPTPLITWRHRDSTVSQQKYHKQTLASVKQTPFTCSTNKVTLFGLKVYKHACANTTQFPLVTVLGTNLKMADPCLSASMFDCFGGLERLRCEGWIGLLREREGLLGISVSRPRETLMRWWRRDILAHMTYTRHRWTQATMDMFDLCKLLACGIWNVNL